MPRMPTISSAFVFWDVAAVAPVAMAVVLSSSIIATTSPLIEKFYLGFPPPTTMRAPHFKSSRRKIHCHLLIVIRTLET